MSPRLGCWLLCLLAGACSQAAPAPSDFQPHEFDWPQWLGPQRTGLSSEKGLLTSWAKAGPPLHWTAKSLGGGFSTPTVASGRVFGMSWRESDEVVWALDEASGKELWKCRIAKAAPARGGEGRQGSRGSVTVDGSLLYALGQNGDLVCLDATTGDLKWHKNLVEDFGGNVPTWGYSESPLIDGDRVIATPGGKSATLVALNKLTGATVWKSEVPRGDAAAYSSVIAANVGGQRQFIQLMNGGVVGIAAEDGKFLWRYDKPANGTANCSTPIASDGYVFAASGYGRGGGLVKLSRSGNETKAEEVYFTRKMVNQHGGMVLVNGYIYGSNEGLLTCLEFKTGKVMWEERTPGKGSIAYADGHLYYRNENGPVFLIEASPDGYKEHGQFTPKRSAAPAWAHPIIANGKLYIIDQDVLYCYNVKQQ